jgi:hypothetical protein
MLTKSTRSTPCLPERGERQAWHLDARDRFLQSRWHGTLELVRAHQVDRAPEERRIERAHLLRPRPLVPGRRRDEVERSRLRRDGGALEDGAGEPPVVALQLGEDRLERLDRDAAPAVLARERVDRVVADAVVRADVDEEEIRVLRAPDRGAEDPGDLAGAFGIGSLAARR